MMRKFKFRRASSMKRKAKAIEKAMEEEGEGYREDF